MSKQRPIFISGLKQFGLSHSDLRRQGERLVTVEIVIDMPPYIYPSRSRLRDLLRMTPTERRTLVRQWHRRSCAALRKELAVNELEVMVLDRAPIGVRLTLPAQSIDRLRRVRNAGAITVRAIKGIRVKRCRRAQSRLYAVTAQMVFQVEDQTCGTQLCEERITIVVARSERDARARVVRIMSAESSPYLLISGHFGRWSFEGITDVCECPDDTFAYKNTEVFYRYKKRRVNAKNEWHPRARK